MVSAVAVVADERRVPRDLLLGALDSTGVSQATLARRLDVSFQTVNRWVNGHAPITRLSWLAITQALGLPATWTPAPKAPPSDPEAT
jgi:plasmid maintenance system antidote protein VapI